MELVNAAETIRRDTAAAYAAELRVPSAPTHPLKAWRLLQRISAGPNKGLKPMNIQDAVDAFSVFIGQKVPFPNWSSWEKYEGEPGFKEPNRFYKHQLFLFTGGAVHPDDFYPVRDWRAQLESLRASASRRAAGG